MVTIKELQRENERLRKMQGKLKEIERKNEARKKLLRENKRIAREIKFGKSIGIGKSAAKITGTVGKASGKALVKSGKAAFVGLRRYADFLAEQEAKQKARNRKLRSVKKKTRRKK